MNTEGLNEYIKNYLTNDKTQRAIMMTAPWGSGKSHYIKNELGNFLQENKLNYVIVSLYGIQSLKDVSKELFLEIKFQKVRKKLRLFNTFGKTILSGTAVVGKTLLKKIANVDIDFNIKEPNYEKIYKSINLKNRLIIFEDLERCTIDIVEFLGYVNNLVEQDGVKVLLVANESEIIKYKEKEDSEQENNKKEYTDKTKEYLKIKEKTISDTLLFTSEYSETIKSILGNFKPLFDLACSNIDEDGNISIVNKIEKYMINNNCFNYRSLLYACQKMEDVLNKIGEAREYTVDFIESVFMGTLVYAFKLNSGNKNVWKDAGDLSSNLGSYEHPLYKFMYSYINNHSFNTDDFRQAYKLFMDKKDLSKADEVLAVIYEFFTESEKDVLCAIDKILVRLEQNKGIDCNEYIRIANYLIAIKHILGYDEKIDKCKALMLKNTEMAVASGKKVQTFAYSGFSLNSKEEVEEMEDFEAQMAKIVENNEIKLNGFDYKPESISDLLDWITKKKKSFINDNGFANKLDIDKTIDMLRCAPALEIQNFRYILQYIYMGVANIGAFMSCDAPYLDKLKVGIDKIIDNESCDDKIVNQQLKWLSKNIGEILSKLRGNTYE